MKLLKNRKIAILFTVVVAIIATMTGVYTTAAKNTRNIEAMFYDGVYLKDEGYTQPGAALHVSSCANAALGLATMMKDHTGFSGKAEELLSARRELMDAGSVRETSMYFREMRDRFQELSGAAVNANLSERDMEAVLQHQSTFTGASTALLHSRYNDEVTDYLSGQSALMRIIGTFVSMKEPAYFTT